MYKQFLTVNKMCENLRQKPEQTFPEKVTTFFAQNFVKNPDHNEAFFCQRIYSYFYIFKKMYKQFLTVNKMCENLRSEP